ncbi:MAG: ATPase [Pseudobutyrivibrio sp.]|nr:ATPase [Pseudobutyrivibrio sp.]
MKEITYKELTELDKDSYTLVDIRNEGSLKYGVIPDSISITHELFETDIEGVVAHLDKSKKVILYCTRGQVSLEDAETLCDFGFDAISLAGGYNSYLSALMEQQEKSGDDELAEKQAEIEKSIRKKFHKTLFSPFARACKQYDLIKEGDHICVCISGGKDSMLMAKLFQEIKRHQKVNFELTFLVMDPGYSEVNRKLIESNAKLMGIPIVIYESDIFNAVDTVDKNPCYLCARMRRGHLYSKAKELGCNKIALGHHYDDVIETILMGMLYGAQIQTMMPKLHSTNFEGMELIRPLYLVRQDDIIAWQRYNGLRFLQCACHFTETCDSCSVDGTSASKRLETRNLIAELKKVNPYVESNIFRSVENVNLATVIAYKQDGVKHHFLDTYDETKGEEE